MKGPQLEAIVPLVSNATRNPDHHWNEFRSVPQKSLKGERAPHNSTPQENGNNLGALNSPGFGGVGVKGQKVGGILDFEWEGVGERVKLFQATRAFGKKSHSRLQACLDPFGKGNKKNPFCVKRGKTRQGRILEKEGGRPGLSWFSRSASAFVPFAI